MRRQNVLNTTIQTIRKNYRSDFLRTPHNYPVGIPLRGFSQHRKEESSAPGHTHDSAHTPLTCLHEKRYTSYATATF